MQLDLGASDRANAHLDTEHRVRPASSRIPGSGQHAGIAPTDQPYSIHLVPGQHMWSVCGVPIVPILYEQVTKRWFTI